MVLGVVLCVVLGVVLWVVFFFISSLLCCQIGKEHLGLKAVTEVLQDLQYKVSPSGTRVPGYPLWWGTRVPSVVGYPLRPWY